MLIPIRLRTECRSQMHCKRNILAILTPRWHSSESKRGLDILERITLHPRNLDFECQMNKQAGYFKELYVTKGYLQILSKWRVGRDLNICTDNHKGTENLRTDFCSNSEIGFDCCPVIVPVLNGNYHSYKAWGYEQGFFQNCSHYAKYMQSLF